MRPFFIMTKLRMKILSISTAASILIFALTAAAGDDPYGEYVKSSIDFQKVRIDDEMLIKAWPGWYYMPWTYEWLAGYDTDSGKFSVKHGYNGAFIDHGQTIVSGTNKLDWINRHGLRFYVDHLAGKGDLHLFDPDKVGPFKVDLQSAGVRCVPLNKETAARLKKLMKERINNVKGSGYRAAYALDDEVSWGHFVTPCMWKATDEDEAYGKWLHEVYGQSKPTHPAKFTTYDAVWPKLDYWAIKDFDCSDLMDQWSFNDSFWCNFIGDLVEYSNSIDPSTPCGIVGAQCPSAFGGYDYAKLMGKLQFIEAYNHGGSQSIIRSFNPNNAIPSVTTHFHKFDSKEPENATESIWQVWYYLAHGNCGHIGWVENWFEKKTNKPRAWHKTIAPHYLEAGNKIGPLVRGAKWIHDKVAIYYSHPSIQLGWILDAEAHKKTWRNRNSDHRLGAAHLVRRAWENMLRDQGLQYNFISYADVIKNGIPYEYKVLILPASICLSETEATMIRTFCKSGGTVIADYLPGLFNNHGQGAKVNGALDDLFDVIHDPTLRAKDIFQKRLWSEVNQDDNFNYQSMKVFLTRNNDCIRHSLGFNKAVRNMAVDKVNQFGKGRAVLMNLSPQWYNAYRISGPQAAKKRIVFMKHVAAAGITRQVVIEGDKDDLHRAEITRLYKNGRTVLFVCMNPEMSGASVSMPVGQGLNNSSVNIKLRFRTPVKNVINERTGVKLQSGSVFEFAWKRNEALVVSFDGTY